MESKAVARFRCIPRVRLRNTVVMGLAGGPAGVWATTAAGNASASSAMCRVFMTGSGVGGKTKVTGRGRQLRKTAWSGAPSRRGDCGLGFSKYGCHQAGQRTSMRILHSADVVYHLERRA